MVVANHFFRFLPLILVLGVLQYGLQIWATIDLVNREKTHGPKWAWVLVILLGETLGPIVYFIFGPNRTK
jgi:hypothetical protein